MTVPFLVGGFKLCMQRGGLAAADRKFDVTANKGCDAGQVRCGGAGTWDTTRVTCQPAGTKCPILNMRYAAYTGSGTSDIIPLESGMALYLERELSSAVSDGAPAPQGPVVNLDVAYAGRQCFGDNSPVGYDDSGSPSFNSAGAYSASSRPTGDTCDETDARYFAVVGVNERVFLEDAFQSNSQCSTANQQNTPAGAGVPSFTGRTCDNSPAGLCRAITQTSRCNKLNAYLPPSTTSTQIQAIERPEIFWAASCKLSRTCPAHSHPPPVTRPPPHPLHVQAMTSSPT